MNTIKICRICLESAVQINYYNIFDYMNDEEYSFSDFIKDISHININKDDNNNLPKWLCEDCVNSLKGILNFIITIRTTNEKLHEEVQQVNGDALNEIKIKTVTVTDADKAYTTFQGFIVLNNDYQHEEEKDTTGDQNMEITEELLDEETNYFETNKQECVCQFQQQQQYEEEEHLLDDDKQEHKGFITLNTPNTKPNDLVPCNLCKRTLKQKNLQKHLDLHNQKKVEGIQRTCAYCPRKFKSSKSLQQHEKIHRSESDNITYTCNECNRQYVTEYQLQNHYKNSHKERDNICPLCGNAFKLKNQLTNHMKLHLEKNINCPHCDKKYARQFDLNVHLRSHTGEMPYACHLCEKRFAIKVRLTYHLQKHYGIKHRCKECSAEFNSKQKLKAHTFKHTGMPYRCELCNNRGFPTRNVFKRHLSRVHNTCMSEETLLEMFQRNTGKMTKIKHIEELDIIQIDETEICKTIVV